LKNPDASLQIQQINEMVASPGWALLSAYLDECMAKGRARLLAEQDPATLHWQQGETLALMSVAGWPKTMIARLEKVEGKK